MRGQRRSQSKACFKWCGWTCVVSSLITLPKTNMEPENHLFEKENHLPNLHFYHFLGSMLVFRGVTLYVVCWCQYVYSLTSSHLSKTRGHLFESLKLRKWMDQRWTDPWVITPMNTPFTSRWVLSHLQPSILTSDGTFKWSMSSSISLTDQPAESSGWRCHVPGSRWKNRCLRPGGRFPMTDPWDWYSYLHLPIQIN